ncbi:MAG TPA: PEP/pyruvate-binding domain-containing protein [Thermoleophilaceae bacterium]
MAIVGLRGRAPVARVGGKFAALAAIRDVVDVPPAVCLTVDELAIALGPEQLGRIERGMGDIRATVGAFILDDQQRVAEAADVAPDGDQRAALLEAVELELGGFAGGLAVRSSAVDEDGAHASRAGVYESVIGVRSPEELWAAVATCWRSYYGPAALNARIRAGDYSGSPRMAVVVQRMVEAELAGVAFSHGTERVEVEWVAGAGASLVSGVAVPERAEVALDAAERAGEPLASVATAVARIRGSWGRDVDVEWVRAGGRLYVVQARLVTGRRGEQQPYFASARLYADDALPAGMELGEVAEVYTTYVTKRSRAYRLAESLGVRTGAAHVVCANGEGFDGAAGRAELERLIGASEPERVVLDLGARQRQLVVDKGDAHARVRELLGLVRGGFERRAFIVRDFVGGSFGAISSELDDGGVLIEASPDGLMSMNRGTAGGIRVIVVRDEGVETDAADPELERSAPTIARFTRELGRELPGVHMEWVVEDGTPYFVDFSSEDRDIHVARDGDAVMMAPGAARGQLLALTDDDLLERLSIGPAVSVGYSDEAIEHEELRALIAAVAAEPRRPIVFARRPYAVLATLFDHVAGFVFADGSLLCHLAILIREAGLPAVLAPEPPLGREVLIADGRLTAVSPEEVAGAAG